MVAVPLPAVRDPVITQLPVEGLVGEYSDVVEESIAVHGGWSGPEVAKTPAVVAMVGIDAMPMEQDTPLDCAEWDICDQFDGSDLCDSDESDW